jgi:pyruvate dehydrogenase E2 component (dihydrolipoamide acetyltransferase)
MAIPVLMPALSPTMEHGRLARWLKKEGDHVSPGDVIAEIETDKATMEVEAVDEGVLARIVVPEGTDNVPVNAVIAILAEEGEDVSDIDPESLAPTTSRGEKAAETTSAPPAPGQTDSGESSRGGPSSGAENAQAPAKKDNRPAPSPAGGGTPSPQAAARPSSSPAGGRILASPLARQLAREHGLDLSRIRGTGPHGRIIRRDVEKALAARAEPAAAPAAATAARAPLPAAGLSDEDILRLYPEGSYDIVPIDSMRRVIAERLTLSKQTVPHFYLTVDCVIDRLLEVRTRLNEMAPRDSEGRPAWKLSVNDFIIKAWAMALKAVPAANATWTSAGILRHRHVDVAVAVAIDGGLITPVIRRAEEKGLVAISGEMKDLAARARARKLMPEEYTGGATSISNLGMYGVKSFAAVINPPHATILAVGRGEPRPVAENGEVVVRNVMTVTLSVDHRAVDGALGAEALAAFRRYVEEPALMLAE